MEDAKKESCDTCQIVEAEKEETVAVQTDRLAVEKWLKAGFHCTVSELNERELDEKYVGRQGMQRSDHAARGAA